MSNIEFKDAFSRYSVGVEVDFTDEIELIAGNSYSQPVAVDDTMVISIAASPVPGARYRTYLLADGMNMPTIEDAFEHDSSSGYDNTDGALNLLEVWHDGLSVLYAWSQFADEAPVVLVGAKILSADRTLVALTFSGALDQSSEPAPADFVLVNSSGPDSITNVAISGSVVTLTRTRDEDNSTVSISYVKGANPLISDLTGHDIVEFDDRSVIYQTDTGDGLTLVRLPDISSNVVESINGEGWDYEVEVIQAAYNICYARSDVVLPSGEDGFFVLELGNGDIEGGPIIGLTANSSADTWEEITGYGIQIYDLNYYGVLNTGAGLLVGPDVYTSAPEVGNSLKVERSGGDLIFSLSTDGGTTYTEFNREPGYVTDELRIFVQLGTQGSKVSLPRVSENWV